MKNKVLLGAFIVGATCWHSYSSAPLARALPRKGELVKTMESQQKSILSLQRQITQKTASEEKDSSLLVCATYHGFIELVKDLIASGANLNEQEIKSGLTLLHIAAQEGYKHLVEYLFEEGADIEAALEKTGWTPLHKASMRGHVEVVQYLLNKGAKIDVEDEIGMTPLHYASLNGHASVVRCLLQKNKVAPIFCYVDDRICDTRAVYYGYMPIHLACKSGSLETVQCLVEHKADINATILKGYHIYRPLYLAALEGSLPIVKYLVEQGASINEGDDRCSEDSGGWTAGQIANSKGHKEVVNYLRSKGGIVDYYLPFSCNLL